MPPVHRLATALVVASAVSACGHARQGTLVRPPAQETVTEHDPAGDGTTGGNLAARTPSVDDRSAPEAPSPVVASAAAPSPSAAAAPSPAAPPPATAADSTSSPARNGDGRAARGALQGAGVVLYVAGAVCFSGGGIMIVVCGALLYYGWPYALGALGLAAAIGAAVSAPSGAVPVGRPPEEPATAPRPPEAQTLPSAEWAGAS